MQSTFTAIAEIKPGRVEHLRQAVQWLSEHVAESPLPAIGTIHFARWVLIDNDTRFLFASHYDGSWDSYMEDFAYKAGDAMDMIFGNCVGYPEGGARDVEGFKQFVRRVELKEMLVFSSYPDATVKDIQKALSIREKFESLLDEFQ